MLILTIAHLDITLDQFYFYFYFYFYLVYTSPCNLVSTAFVCGFRKVDFHAYEDRVKVNYFRLIMSKREPQTDYAESTSKKSSSHAELGRARSGLREE